MESVTNQASYKKYLWEMQWWHAITMDEFIEFKKK